MLLTPGPTPVPEFARKAMSDITIHHRTKEFEAIFERTRNLLIEIYNMPEVLMLASSGTGAMEACVTNFTRKKALTVNSGKFGERFGKICKAFNIDYTEIKNEWNTAVSVEDVINEIKNDSNIDAIFIQICESAGGLRHPVEEIAKEVKKISFWHMAMACTWIKKDLGLSKLLSKLSRHQSEQLLCQSAMEHLTDNPKAFFIHIQAIAMCQKEFF
jgi:aspartate aminotransferase-like enzyme